MKRERDGGITATLSSKESFSEIKKKTEKSNYRRNREHIR